MDAPGLGKFGKYLLHERIGAGGMAEVWVATLPGAGGIDKRCVLKRILPRHARTGSFVEMFLEEARISISLQHGNIVPVFDFGETDGTYYLAMECVHGVDLRAVLRRAAASATPIPVELAAFVTVEVCRGLAYAHTKVGADGKLLRLVHRDVSPSNILVSFEGDVKLTDFGIAKVRGSAVQTVVSELKGKIPYMSPEQARGEPLDARTDLWAAAVVLYEMLAGRRPYHAEDPLAILEKVRAAGPVAPARSLRADVPEELDRLIGVAMAKEPAARFPDARTLQVALSRFLAARSPVTAADLRAFLGRLFPRESERFNPALSIERRAIEPEEEEPTEVRPVAKEAPALATQPVETAVSDLSLARTVLHQHPTPTRRSRWLLVLAAVIGPGLTAAVLAVTSGAESDPPPERRLRTAEPATTQPAAPSLPAPVAAGPPRPPAALPAARSDSSSTAPPPVGLPPSSPSDPSQPAERAPSPARPGGALRPGTLVVTSVPWAEVFVDGRRRAESTPATLRLPPGPHSVRLVNPESGGRDVRSVEIRAGETTRIAGHPR